MLIPMPWELPPLYWIIYIESFVIVLLLIVTRVLYLRLIVMDSERYEAVAERDELRVAVATMREMSRTHADTVTQIAALKGKKKHKGGY